MKLKSLIEAKGPDVSGLVQDIGKATDRNDHTEARLLIAKFLKDKKLEKILNGIKEIHLEMGSMPPELSKLRNAITDAMMKTIETKHGKEVAKQIHDAL